MNRDPVVVAISEGGDLTHAVRLLERLREQGVESHLVVKDAVRSRVEEAGVERWDDVRAKADRCYDDANLAARIASGSFVTRGMVVAPCSAVALAAIATGFAAGLVERAADVTLKEGRPLVLLVPGAPGSPLEADHVSRAKEGGAIILPMAGAELGPTLDQVVDRVLAALSLPSEVAIPS